MGEHETCDKCGKPMDIAPNDGTQHDVCLALFNERSQNNICVCCGENPIRPTGWQKWWTCGDCGENGEFKGYPGPD